MIRALLVCLLVLAAGTVAAVLIVYADPNLLRQPITAWASNQLGRSIVIDGELDVQVGRMMSLRATGLRVPDADAARQADMLAIRRLLFEVETRSLLSRPVVVRRVEIEGASLRLEASTAAVDASGERSASFEWPESLPVVFREIVVSESRVFYATPRLSRPVDLRLTRLSQTHADMGLLKIDGDGQLNEIPLRIEGSVGPFEQLLSARDFAVALNVAAGDLVIGMETRIDSLANPVGSTVRLNLHAPDTEYLRANLGLSDLGPGAVELDGEVTPDPGSGGLRGALKGQVGQFAVDASGEVTDPATMKRASLALDLSGPDLEFAGAVAGIGNLPPEPFQLTALLTRDSERLRVDDAKLTIASGEFSVSGSIDELSSMTGVDGTFVFQGADVAGVRAWLGLPAQLRGPYRVSGKLQVDGKGAQSVDVTAATNLVELRLTGQPGAYPDYYDTRVRVEASGASLRELGEAGGISGLPARAFTANGGLEWTPRGVVLDGLQTTLGPDRLNLDGRIGKTPGLAETDVRFAISGENIGSLAGSDGFDVIDGLPPEPYALKGRLRRDKGASRLDDVRGTLAGARVAASGRISDTPASDTQLKVEIDGPELRKFAGLLPGYTLPGGQFSAAGSVALTRQRLQLDGVTVSLAGATATADVQLDLPISNATGRFDVAARGPDLAQVLSRVGANRMPGGPFDLALQGSTAGGRWKFDKAQLGTGVARVVAAGTLDWAPDFSATKLRVDIEGNSLADVGQLADVSLPAQSFAVGADLKGTPTAVIVRDASGRLGKVAFTGELTVDVADRPMIDLRLKTPQLDLRPFMAAPARPSKATAPRGAARDKGLIPDYRLPIGWLGKFDGSVFLQADRARIVNLSLRDASLNATVRDGQLRLESFDAQVPPGGHIAMSGELIRTEGTASLELAASGSGVALSLPDEARAQQQTRPRSDFELELAGQGASLRDLAASLDGRLSLTAGAGELPAVDTGKYFGSLWRQLAGVISPGFNAEPTRKVSCLGAFVSASRGVLKTVPAVVVQTDRTNVIARGMVNLGTEEVDVLLRITQRRNLDITLAEIVNPNVRLTGTLTNLSPQVDTKTTIVGGGAAVATAGLSIVALHVWDRAFKAKNPCAEIEKQAKSLESGEKPKRRSLLPKLLRRP